jgi:hypothetical protein
MTDEQERHPLDELKDVFEKAAEKAREAWTAARNRSEAASRESALYRELVTLGSAAYDALDRAAKKAWGGAGPR